MVSKVRPKSIWYASCIGPFIDLSKPPEVGTFVLIRQLNILVLNKIWINHVCIRSEREV